MTNTNTGRLRILLLASATGLATTVPLGGMSPWASVRGSRMDPVVVHGQGNRFGRGSVSLHAGQTLVVEQDEGSGHHLYVEHPRMSFDEGEQGPRSTTAISFPEPGRFRLLCGIHPKMRLDVEVGQD